MPDTSLDFKTGLAIPHSACEVVIEALDDMYNLLWDPVCPEDAPKTISVDAIKGFFEIYKVDVQLSQPFCALLNDVSQAEYLVYAPLPFRKSDARFSVADLLPLKFVG